MDFNNLLFSLEGRISRKPYWIGILVIVMSSIVLTMALGPMFGLSIEELKNEARPSAAVKLDLLVNLIVLWPGLAITIKRLHDRNRSAIWGIALYALFGLAIILQLLGLIGTPQSPDPVYIVVLLAMLGIGLWLFVDLGFLRGTNGVNDYGPDPLAGFDAQNK
jgi:uncharacterized membrane protein YhaH (DUF805 family)